MESMVAKFIVVSGSIAAAVLFVVLQLTTPATIHPVGLLGVFILIYIVIASVVTLILYQLGMIRRNLIARSPQQKVLPVWTLRSAYLYGSVVAFAPVIFLGMMSVGTIGVVDVLLVVVLESIALFYLWRRQ